MLQVGFSGFVTGTRFAYFLLDGSNDAMQLAYEIMQHKTTMSVHSLHSSTYGVIDSVVK